MNQWILAIVGLVYVFSVALTVMGWRSYEDGDFFNWIAKGRWLWTAVILLISLVGFFTTVAAMGGFYLQPAPIIAKPIDWPDPGEINHLSRDWTHPDTLIAYQDDTTHIRFMHRYDLPSGTLLHPGPDTLIKP